MKRTLLRLTPRARRIWRSASHTEGRYGKPDEPWAIVSIRAIQHRCIMTSSSGFVRTRTMRGAAATQMIAPLDRGR